MTLRIIAILVFSIFHISCCRQSFSYPDMADITKIEVSANSSARVINEITDNSELDKIIRFIDERRSRWCSPRFGSLPDAPVTLFLQVRTEGKGKIGLGQKCFVAQFSGGQYKMDISDEEFREFLNLIGANEEQLFNSR